MTDCDVRRVIRKEQWHLSSVQINEVGEEEAVQGVTWAVWLLLLLLSCFSHVRSVLPHRWQPTRLCRPWDSPGRNTGVGCHFLLQCIKVKVKSLSWARLLATPWTTAHQAPLSMGFSRQEYWNGVPSPSPGGSVKWYSLGASFWIFNLVVLKFHFSRFLVGDGALGPDITLFKSLV